MKKQLEVVLKKVKVKGVSVVDNTTAQAAKHDKNKCWTRNNETLEKS